MRTRFGALRTTAKRVNRIKDRSVFLRNRLLTACTFSLSSHAKAQEFVNVLNMVMRPGAFERKKPGCRESHLASRLS